MDNVKVENEMRIADAVRRACVEAAEGAYEDAGIRGLCAEGRWEVALDAIRRVDLRGIIRALSGGAGDASAGAETDPPRE